MACRSRASFVKKALEELAKFPSETRDTKIKEFSELLRRLKAGVDRVEGIAYDMDVSDEFESWLLDAQAESTWQMELVTDFNAMLKFLELKLKEHEEREKEKEEMQAEDDAKDAAEWEFLEKPTVITID